MGIFLWKGVEGRKERKKAIHEQGNRLYKRVEASECANHGSFDARTILLL